MFTFLSEVRSELTKVTWPTQAEIIRLTIVVIIISVVVGVYLGGADFLFTNLLGILVK
jgi:preprotein translocase subunit SecE